MILLSFFSEQRLHKQLKRNLIFLKIATY